ncbi:HNH endonuclease signature motif containing protein [Candidatus Binatus sp.]|uniref:HNH endonuclease signature motif containing protein n=1 Tax=Candidatus Binatus sp. TaxID=2811406 RepID=UPI003F96590D
MSQNIFNDLLLGRIPMSDLFRKDAVWLKGAVIPGYDPTVWRRDSMGSVIRYSDYGDRESEYGWEQDHIDPDGPDDLRNLQPLHWRNNAWKSDKPLSSTPFADLLKIASKK